jgi:hypothetical protein
MEQIVARREASAADHVRDAGEYFWNPDQSAVQVGIAFLLGKRNELAPQTLREVRNQPAGTMLAAGWAQYACD